MGFKYINTEYLEMVAGGDSDLLKELIGCSAIRLSSSTAN